VLWHLESLLRSIRLAVRVLGRSPLFTITVVLTLGLAIGVNSAVFSAINAVLLSPLDFPDGDRLVRIRQIVDGEANEMPIAAPRLEDWNAMASSFDSITGYYVEDVSDTTGEFPERVRRAVVAPRFLSVWGVGPALGRDFTDAEQRQDGSSAILVSDRYWRTRLGGDRNVIGETVRIEDRPYSVVGVLPASFRFPVRDVDLWWPYPIDAPDARNTLENRKLQWYTGIGRLKPGVTEEQAAVDLRVVQSRLAAEYPDSDARLQARIAPLKATIVADSRASFWLLFGAVTVLLLTACVNVASLLLARAAQREHDMALRLSIGATRATLVGQLFVEVALLATAGAAFGLFLTSGLSAAVRSLAPILPRQDELRIDGDVLVYTIATTVIVTLLCGLLPGLKAARGASSSLQSTRALVSPRNSVQWLLVGAQVALSVTLLAGAGLLLRSLHELSRVEPGFEVTDVLAFRVSGNWNENYDAPDRLVERVNTALDELVGLPGIEAAATSWTLPGVPGAYQTEFEALDSPADPSLLMVASSRAVSPEYFSTMQIPLIGGDLCRRLQTGIHRPGPAMDLMVNQSFANRYFSGRSIIGQRLSWDSGTLNGRVTGVVGDARELGIDNDPAPTVYACDSAPSPFPWYLVRTTGDTRTTPGIVRQRLKEIEPLRSVYAVALLEEQIGAAYSQTKWRAVLLAFFAATALFLSCLGVYSTLSYVVGLRRREVGLRMAVGAASKNIASQFFFKTIRVVAVACVFGLGLALAFSRALGSMLYGVSGADPATLAGVICVVLLVATTAALVPSLRASRIDPVRALREG
jgi:putative ABC transport system permease protein